MATNFEKKTTLHLESLPVKWRGIAKDHLAKLTSDYAVMGRRRYIDWLLCRVHDWPMKKVEEERVKVLVGVWSWLC